MKKYFLIGIVIFAFMQSSCKKEPKGYVNVTDFKITQSSDTVPTTIRLTYSIEVQNDCSQYIISFTGADSIRYVIYDENSPNDIDQLKFDVSAGDLIGNACIEKEAIVVKGILDLQYWNAGDYDINIKFDGTVKEKKSFTLTASN